MSEQLLLNAIHEDDRPLVRKLLRMDTNLASIQTGEAILYQDKIVHWLYAGDTPLHLAAAGHRVEIVELLLGARANPNAAQNHRRSGPLHYAADGCPDSSKFDSERQVKTLQRLLEAGAEINAQDKNGATPLHRAVRTRSANAVRFLIQQGSDLSLVNHSGSSAFHLAVQNTGKSGSGSEAAKKAQRDIIEEFLAAGCSVEVKDGNGKSVVDCAKSPWIQELLSRGA